MKIAKFFLALCLVAVVAQLASGIRLGAEVDAKLRSSNFMDLSKGYITEPWLRVSSYIRKQSWPRNDHMGIIIEDMWGKVYGICTVSGSLNSRVQNHYSLESGQVRRGLPVKCTSKGCGVDYIMGLSDVRSVIIKPGYTFKYVVDYSSDGANGKILARKNGNDVSIEDVCQGTWTSYTPFKQQPLKFDCPIGKMTVSHPVVKSMDSGDESTATITKEHTEEYSIEHVRESTTTISIQHEISMGSKISLSIPKVGDVGQESSQKLSTTFTQAWREMVTSKTTITKKTSVSRSIKCGPKQKAAIVEQKYCHTVDYKKCTPYGMKERYSKVKLNSGSFDLCNKVISAHCIGEDGMLDGYKVATVLGTRAPGAVGKADSDTQETDIADDKPEILQDEGKERLALGTQGDRMG